MLEATLKEKYRYTCLLEYEAPMGRVLRNSPSYIWLWMNTKGGKDVFE